MCAEMQVRSIMQVLFQHKYGYIRHKRSGLESYPYPVKEGQRYIKLNPGHLFVQQPPKKGKGSRGSFKLLRQRLHWETTWRDKRRWGRQCKQQQKHCSSNNITSIITIIIDIIIIILTLLKAILPVNLTFLPRPTKRQSTEVLTPTKNNHRFFIHRHTTAVKGNVLWWTPVSYHHCYYLPPNRASTTCEAVTGNEWCFFNQA